MSEDGNPFQKVTTVPPSDTEYNHIGLFKNGSTYKYFIRAISSTTQASSSSCQKISTFIGTELPDSIVITQATVVENAYVKVNYLLFPANLIKSLQLLRADKKEGPYSVVNTLTSTGFLLPDFYIYDSTALVNKQSYYYQLAYVDDCSQLSFYSADTVRTIYCKCSEIDGGSKIEWNGWEEFDYGISEYTLKRKTGIVNQIITTTSPSEFSYIDNLIGVSLDEEVCYTVTANENPGNLLITGASTTSNTCCLMRNPIVIAPNAFRPYGENSIFKPWSANMAEANYSMSIYNKWGTEIFHTNSKDFGWDGTVNGSMAPLGIYFYIIRYDSLTGESFEKKGNLVLLL
jgi:gliding motility-associated-like protein